MRLLVIGGTSFMGPFVVQHLVDAGHEVAVFHRGTTIARLPTGVGAFRGDRKQLQAHAGALRDFRPDVVIDMILFTEQDACCAIETFRGVADRMVVPSSIDVYRACSIFKRTDPGPPVPTPIDEGSPSRLQPFPLRGLIPGMEEYDKLLVERAVQSEPSLPATCLRLPMVYGPGDRLHRLLEFLERMDDGRRYLLMNERMAAWRGSRIYVENAAAAIARAATDARATGRIYNVAEAEPLTMRDWAARLAEVVGWGGEIVLVPPHQLPPHLRAGGMETAQDLVLDSARIRAELGWTEQVPLAEGLRRSVDWARAHPPPELDAQAFDYSAEDECLARLRGEGR
ncbi:MAG: NAD-dependent epimerase/dehydratase family protein [Myxococcales bacterium]|nr:NAD-dependent epimerase/dehydratase family protein [Myxococcales bacterium]